MRQTPKSPGEKIVKDIKRATRRHYSSEEKIRIVLDGLRGEDSIAELCRREGISQGIYYKWSKDFMEAGKKRLAGDTARTAKTDEVKDLRREARDLTEVVAEQTLELRLLKKACSAVGATTNEVLASRFFTIDEVAQRYGISHASVWRWVKNDDYFPAPIKLSPGTSRWSEEQLAEFEYRAASRQVVKKINQTEVAAKNLIKGRSS